MNVARSIEQLQSALAPERDARHSIGLVPTLGALHEGHMSHVRSAGASCHVVVVSIFLNPLQFGPGEDFETYPRDEEADLALLDGSATDVVFLPPVETMYPASASTTISVGALGDVLEGAHRSGHFDGVCTVVAKLFNLVRPDRAFFGQKDAQQVAVIRRMVRDLNFPVEIVVGPTIREGDGLAMSSRNAYLRGDDRIKARGLYHALQEGQRVVLSSGNVLEAEKKMTAVLKDAGLEPDYAVARDPDTFAAPSVDRPVLLAVAARVGRARLIDNLLLPPSHATGARRTETEA
jgi:pantoate--beta-alanine ligase